MWEEGLGEAREEGEAWEERRGGVRREEGREEQEVQEVWNGERRDVSRTRRKRGVA